MSAAPLCHTASLFTVTIVIRGCYGESVLVNELMYGNPLVSHSAGDLRHHVIRGAYQSRESETSGSRPTGTLVLGGALWDGPICGTTV